MPEKLSATAWFPLQEPGACEVCGAASSALSPDGTAAAGELALALLSRGQAALVLEVAVAKLTGAIGAGRASVLVPELGGMWRVLTSSSDRETHDIMIDSLRYPELSEVRRTGTPFLAPDVESAAELGPARPFLAAAGVRGLAVFPIFMATAGAEPVVLKLSYSSAPAPSDLAYATLGAHLLVHRLSRFPRAEVAAQLGIALPSTGVTDPGSLLNVLPVAAVVVDGEGHVLRANARALWLLRGRGAAAETGALVLTLRPENPWDIHGWRWEAQVTGSRGDMHVLGWSADVAPGRRLVLLEPHPEARRRSFERRMRQTLAEKLRELEAANALLEEHARSRARFVSDAAHELKTPLAILLSYLDTLNDDLADGLSGQQREFLHVARHGGRRLQRLTDELLDLAALESGHLPLSLGPVSSQRVIMSVFDELRPLAAGARVELRGTGEPELPVRADEERLGQVLRNLIENGLKYTRAGGEVAVVTHRRGDHAVLCVRDNGVGIPPESLPHIFEEFVRVPGQDNVAGAGLGLAIVRRLVLAMGGRVWAESTPGSGSTFSVELPLWTGEG